MVLFHDLGCIENITYKNRGQEKGKSSKTIYVKTCRMSALLLHHINTHQTLIKTRILLKQSRKTHKTDAKKMKKSGPNATNIFINLLPIIIFCEHRVILFQLLAFCRNFSGSTKDVLKSKLFSFEMSKLV